MPLLKKHLVRLPSLAYRLLRRSLGLVTIAWTGPKLFLIDCLGLLLQGGKKLDRFVKNKQDLYSTVKDE